MANQFDSAWPRFYYLPKPYPDELLGSFLIRIGRQLGLPVKTFHRAIGLLPSCKWPLFFHSPLDPLADALKMPAEELLFRHTPFPYVTAFTSQDKTRRFALAYIHGNSRLASALTQSLTVGAAGLRYCEVCIKEDRLNFGEDYWHRRHNLPFVTHCWKHQFPLSMASPARGSCTNRLPYEEQPSATVPLLFSEETHRHIEAISSRLLESQERHPSTKWQQDYRDQALIRGFAWQADQIWTKSLIKAVNTYFGVEALAKVKLAIRKEDASWPAGLLRREETSNITVKHVLMQVFLQFAPTSAPEPKKKPGPHPLKCEEMDLIFTSAIEQKIQQLQPGERLTVKQLLTDLAILQRVRHHRASLPETHRILEEFRHSEFSVRQMGGRGKSSN